MSTPSAYQKVVTQYDITEAGVPSIAYANYDGVDDILPITLPAITGGTVALVGLSGIWIEDDWDYAGGTLNIGPTTIAGLPAGILSVVGNLCAVIINDRAWTAAERAGVVAWGKSRGAPGVFSLGPELVTNGTFDSDVSGWTADATGTIAAVGGKLVLTTASAGDSLNPFAYTSCDTEVGANYLYSAGLSDLDSNAMLLIGHGPNQGQNFQSAQSNSARTEAGQFSASVTDTHITLRGRSVTIGQTNSLDNVSVRKLELIP